MSFSNEQCSAEVSSKGLRFYRGRACANKVTVLRDGKTFCRIHDPEFLKAKSDKAQNRFREEMQARYQAADDRMVGAWLRKNSEAYYREILEGKRGV